MGAFPKFTIVTPSYNQGRFLEKTILSVLNQDYPNLEYFVIDGGSSDETVSIIERYSRHIDYWVSEPDRGQSHAINKGFARATGELFGWLNSDDRLEAGALHIVAERAARCPDAGAFVGQGQMVDESEKLVYYKTPEDLSFAGFCRWTAGGDFMQPSCFFRRSAWEAAGPLDENIHIAMDLDLWLRMVQKVRFERLDVLLSTSLRHGRAKTTALRNEMLIDAAIVVIKAGGEEHIRPELVEMARAATAYRASRLRNRPFVRPFMRVGNALWSRMVARYRLREATGKGPA
jgi:glycosyltransferase involved in cell wall biosynthesis